MSKYDYIVRTEKIRPFAGTKIEWAAKARIKRIDSGDEWIILHEHFGKSEKEAEGKAEKEAKEWIADHEAEE